MKKEKGKGKSIGDIKEEKKGKSWLGKIWYFIWYDDSIWSWIINVILAFVLIKFIIYPGLGFALGTPYPIVAVVSGSMDHHAAGMSICGYSVDEQYEPELFWNVCGSWYMERNITKQMFESYPFSQGFHRGDIFVLYGRKTENIKIGDVIVFTALNQQAKPDPIIHRVIGAGYDDTTGMYYETKGDHNPTSITDSIIGEHRIDDDRIIGAAVFRIPYLGYVKIMAVEIMQAFTG